MNLYYALLSIQDESTTKRRRSKEDDDKHKSKKHKSHKISKRRSDKGTFFWFLTALSVLQKVSQPFFFFFWLISPFLFSGDCRFYDAECGFGFPEISNFHWYLWLN